MLEQLADYDDELMEQLLSDVPPPRDKIFDDLAKELRDGLIVPVLLGSAENGNGILRLLKALRHEAPFVEATASGSAREGRRHMLKTIYTPHGGKLSVVRVLSGEFGEGTISGARPRSGSPACSRCSARRQQARHRQGGDTVALGRLESQDRRDAVSDKGGKADQARRQPVYGVAIGVKDRKDEVKLTAAIAG